MSLSRTPFVVVTALTVGLVLHPGPARSADVTQSGAQVVPNERVTESVALRDVTVDGGIVSGVLTNTSGVVGGAFSRSLRMSSTSGASAPTINDPDAP